MAESKPLTAAERDECDTLIRYLRAMADVGPGQAGILEAAETIERLLAERDALDRANEQLELRLAQALELVEEARGMAWALRVWAGEDGVRAPQGLLDEFDALHWPDPEEEEG
jgi:hypothetical protein